ncbi:MAG: hypothetical protein ACOYN8_02800 [Pseudanabaena sp.]|jgi:hypothetical protein
MKVVIDTNILVSAAIRDGIPELTFLEIPKMPNFLLVRSLLMSGNVLRAISDRTFKSSCPDDSN